MWDETGRAAAMDLDLEGRDEGREGFLAGEIDAPQWISTWRVETSQAFQLTIDYAITPQWISTWRVETRAGLSVHELPAKRPQWIST